MSVVLPTFVGSASSSWQLADWLTPSWSSQPATGGRATITCDQLDNDELWLIEHAVVSCTSSTDTRVRWYDSGVDVQRLRDGSDSGNFDVADWPRGLVLRPSTQLVVEWTGASNGAVGTLTLQVQQLRR